MTLRPIAGLLLALLLAGCQSVDVAPAKSSLHIPSQWRAEAGPASPAEQLWWRNFHDSHLNRYVDEALKNNSDVLIARERINEYQARVYAADGSLFPSLDAGVTGARARSQSAATGLPIYSTLYAHCERFESPMITCSRRKELKPLLRHKKRRPPQPT